MAEEEARMHERGVKPEPGVKAEDGTKSWSEARMKSRFEPRVDEAWVGKAWAGKSPMCSESTTHATASKATGVGLAN